jgi:hypothetical protein
MALRPQDLLVSLKLAIMPALPRPLYPALASALQLSPSEIHGAVRRATAAGLLDQEQKPNRTALMEFIVHGVKYVWAPKRGRVTRGIPTAHGAPPLLGELGATSDPVPVWPEPNGIVRGESLEPLYRSVPRIVANDPQLYEVLCLLDAIRAGRARERSLAEQHLRRILGA